MENTPKTLQTITVTHPDSQTMQTLLARFEVRTGFLKFWNNEHDSNNLPNYTAEVKSLKFDLEYMEFDYSYTWYFDSLSEVVITPDSVELWSTPNSDGTRAYSRIVFEKADPFKFIETTKTPLSHEEFFEKIKFLQHFEFSLTQFDEKMYQGNFNKDQGTFQIDYKDIRVGNLLLTVTSGFRYTIENFENALVIVETYEADDTFSECWILRPIESSKDSEPES